MRSRNNWTAEEDAELRRRYPTEPTQSIANDLGRPVSSVYNHAANLGLKKGTEFFASEHSGRISTARRAVIGPRLWTESEEQVLREMWPNSRAIEVARKLDRPESGIYKRATELGLKKTEEFLNSALSGRQNLAVVGRDTRFTPGHVPANKGKKGLCVAPEHTLFQRGHRPFNVLPVGSITSTSDGYRKVKIAEPNKWQHLHRYNWVEAHGPIPDGMCLAFKDGDRTNCEVSNLELITRAERCRRNSIHKYPPEVRATIRVLGKLRREINQYGEK